MIESKSVDGICRLIKAEIPAANLRICDLAVEKIWDKITAHCPKGRDSLKFPSPQEIEKLVCKIATEKQIEDESVGEVCQVITEKFPSLHFQPDCETAVRGLWDAVTARCP